LNLIVDYLCTCVEDVGVDSLSPLGASIEDLEFDGALVIGVGDVKANGVSSLSVGDTNQFVGGLATNVADLL
jgi:hypothetical protein